VRPHGPKASGGLGIDLALVNRLVEMHGGRISTDSAAGDAEVENLRVAVLVHHHVLRLQVAMDDSHAVRFGETVANIPRDADNHPLAQAADLAHQALQILAADELHREVVDAFGLPEVEQPADVAVADPAGELEFPREALDRRVVRRRPGGRTLIATLSFTRLSMAL